MNTDSLNAKSQLRRLSTSVGSADERRIIGTWFRVGAPAPLNFARR